MSDAGTDESGAVVVALFDAHLDEVYGYLRRRLGQEDAQDLTAEVFHRAVRVESEGRGSELSIRWLMVTARNLLIDRWRQAEARAAKADLLRPPPPPCERSADTTEIVLDELPDHYRAVLVLRYLEDHTVDETAAVIGRTPSATESLLTRARRRFRDLYLERA